MSTVIKIYGESKVYTTAKNAATEYAYWSNSQWEQKNGIRSHELSARQIRLEQRVTKLFQRILK